MSNIYIINIEIIKTWATSPTITTYLDRSLGSTKVSAIC